MSKSKIYYKVVTHDLQSAIINPYLERHISHYKYNATKDFCVQYKINEWVKPEKPGTKLMVFSNLDDAKEFALFQGIHLLIYKCSVRNPTKHGFITDLDKLGYIYPTLIKRIKQKKKITDLYQECEKNSIPEGTVFCSAVKLLEEVNTR